MLVGQALALLYLDPAAVERGGVVSQEEVVGQLSAVLGSDALIALFSPGKRKRQDERIAQRNVRQRVGEAVRRLANLGFVELSDANALRLRAALLRFAEPVRGLSEPAEALAKLVAQGEVALASEQAGDEPLDDVDDELAADDAEQDLEGEPASALNTTAAGAHARPAAVDSADTGEGPRVQTQEAAAESGEEVHSSDPGDAWDESCDSGIVPRAEALAAAARTGEVSGGDVLSAEAFGDESSASDGVKPRALGDDADGGGAVAGSLSAGRKSPPARRVVPDEDLDWSDILLPEREDAEDGS
jgi:hypothetical protein